MAGLLDTARMFCTGWPGKQWAPVLSAWPACEVRCICTKAQTEQLLFSQEAVWAKVSNFTRVEDWVSSHVLGVRGCQGVINTTASLHVHPDADHAQCREG